MCSQVQQKHEDEEKLARAISQKLMDVPGVSFSEIASQALEHGRKQLAVRVQTVIVCKSSVPVHSVYKRSSGRCGHYEEIIE